VFNSITWKKALILAIATGLIIEVAQAVLNVGIFDVDDIILNAVGVMLGYGMHVLLTEWIRSKDYTKIVIVIMVLIITGFGALYALYPKNQPVINSDERTLFKKEQ
jgi:glycopeptide antibiotics resistance protein